MGIWPALETSDRDSDLLLAIVDDYSPTAVEDRGDATRIFFATAGARDEALAELIRRGTSASPIDVPDDDWARRSQESITPITVGRITVAPPWHAGGLRAALAGPPALSAGLLLVIQPSMGFGTGHHATTRLCLRSLQAFDLERMDVLDVGTGSGVLAIAARMLGARRARGIDNDPDAIASAMENLTLNPDVDGVAFEIADLASGVRPAEADVVTANLTGALLERSAAALLSAVRPGGAIILSGLMMHEGAAVQAAFSQARFVNKWEEDGWAALAFIT